MRQGSEYISGYNYGRILDIPGFLARPVSAYSSVAQGSEYAWIWLNNAMVGF